MIPCGRVGDLGSRPVDPVQLGDEEDGNVERIGIRDIPPYVEVREADDS